MVEREVKCWTVEELESGEDMAALLSITVWYEKWGGGIKQLIMRPRDIEKL